VSQTASEQASADANADGGSDGISGFLTRILDQLSLSSWLPAIMVICNLAVLLQLGSQKNLDISAAVLRLAGKPLGILVVLVLGIIVASIATQAFEFESIRLLEGYWGSFRMLAWWSRICTGRHVRRLRRVRTRLERLTDHAFDSAIQSLDGNQVPADLIDVIGRIHRDEPLTGYDANLVSRARKLDLRRFARADILHRIDATESLIRAYPQPHRILPTTLGNTLRSREDQLSRDGEENLEEFVFRRYQQMNSDLKTQHHRFRSQLNIYCLLTLIFFALAVLSATLLSIETGRAVGAAAFSAVYLLSSLVSYRAAISSARGYVSVLRVIGSGQRPAPTPGP
jgi:hypothetical protein